MYRSRLSGCGVYVIHSGMPGLSGLYVEEQMFANHSNYIILIVHTHIPDQGADGAADTTFVRCGGECPGH